MGKVFRRIQNQMDFTDGPVKSGSGKDMVIVVPFKCEVRVKSICLISGDDGEAPQTLKLCKNEAVVDIDIQEDKTPDQKIDLNQGALEYPTNVAKWSSVSNIVLGVDGSFGASRSALKFIGLKGERLRDKSKGPNEIVYEARAMLK